MSNVVIVSTVAGMVPTTGNLKEGQLGVNTADGKLFSNNGTEIISVGGGNLWNQESEARTLVHTFPDAPHDWETVMDVQVGIAVSSIELRIYNPSATTTQIEVRVTRDGIVLPTATLARTSSGSGHADFIAARLTDRGYQLPVMFCKTLKIEARKTIGASTSSVSINYSLGSFS